MLIFIFLLINSAFGADILIKNKTTVEYDLDINLSPYVSEEISFRVSTGLIEKNQILIGLKYRVSENFSTSLNLFLQNHRKHEWKLDYGPLVKMNIIF